MTHITFYEKPGCGGNAKQRALLAAAGHTLEVRNLLRWRWTPRTLFAFLEPLPVHEWFNRAAPDIKSGRIVPESLDAGSALALLLAQPLLIRRPLMEAGDTRMVGFDTARVHAWVGLGLPEGLSHPPRSFEGCAAAMGDCATAPH
ncbi:MULTISPECIES: ArsC/Spx/MgsR family protein [Paraburkholderia]|uniref:Nitrogenase-associated protein n=1 Tax=Paraburkholderia tropica TaxID=92647 RepID=A0AAQ1GNW9_9BURK|nr:ArsC/Spx/MgsR family protein [Paraburkholderia tropica]MBB2983994.1 nitrogenase-associated protein [Paraburkholderia tropica]MBB3004777.1 nitrogenase-associated protein [Paraburkholderia tropica]MBB6323817.1 nitrogenase-associated protein [Paraburkholderia tropica]PXX07918.1 nitrogenase-associated protein [Paraburkholderia tropica]PZW73338.1 nitrogenase-associated protein [Paraburkholderia tropica]